MPGIQLHPHDILDEGMAQIVPHLRRLGDVRYLLPEVNTIFERNPVPVGVLPRNPVHEVVQGAGELFAALPSYLGSGLDQRRAQAVVDGRDPLREILALDGDEFAVVPWLNLLNGDFVGERLQDNLVRDHRDRPIAHWLCPNGPDVVAFWTRAIVDLRERYGFRACMIDRIRYPDWAGTRIDPRQLLTCFCAHCRRGMAADGIDAAAVTEAISAWTGLVKAKDFEAAVDLAADDQRLRSWIAFRQRSVSSFVTRLLDELRSLEPDLEVWLDLWPPAYGWLLGQDYTALTAASGTLKHFPYHRLGGGADVQGLIEDLADTPEEREAAFRAFQRFFDVAYPQGYAEFKADGFPIEFVSDQNRLVRELSQPGTRVFSGVQMWNLPPENLVEAIAAAERSDADDLLYYCYGWADDALLDAVSSLRAASAHEDKESES